MTVHKERYLWACIGLAALIGGVVLYLLLFSSSPDYVKVKYRDDRVNISASNFEPLDRSDSIVSGAWYDNNNEYMIIKLGGTYYHYCSMTSSSWGGLKSATSLSKYYQDDIKGHFDCRVNPVPKY